MAFINFDPVFLLNMNRSSRRVYGFKKRHFVLRNFPMFGSNSLSILGVGRTIYLSSINFTRFFINYSNGIAKLSNFVRVFNNGLTFNRACPVDQIVKVLISRLIRSGSNLLCMFYSNHAMTVNNNYRRIFIVFMRLHTPFRPLCTFLQVAWINMRMSGVSRSTRIIFLFFFCTIRRLINNVRFAFIRRRFNRR